MMQRLRDELSYASDVSRNNALKREYKIHVELDDVDEHKKTLKWQHFFKQDINSEPIRYPAALAALLFAIENGQTDQIPALKLPKWESGLWPFFMQNLPQVALALAGLSKERDLSKKIKDELFWAIEKYSEHSMNSHTKINSDDRAEKYLGLLPSGYLRRK